MIAALTKEFAPVGLQVANEIDPLHSGVSVVTRSVATASE